MPDHAISRSTSEPGGKRNFFNRVTIKFSHNKRPKHTSPKTVQKSLSSAKLHKFAQLASKAVGLNDVITLNEIFEQDQVPLEDIDPDGDLLYRSSEAGNLEMVKLLSSYTTTMRLGTGRDVTALQIAVKKGYTKVVSVLAKYHSVVSRYEAKTALHYAVFHKNADIAKLLIYGGANVNARDIYGGTPLQLACKKSLNEIARFLLSNKALVDECDNEGWTALHFVAQAGSVEVVKTLLNHRANLEAQTKYGRTPLHCASSNASISVLEILISKGANFNVCDVHGKKPVDYASDLKTFHFMTRVLRQDKPDLDKTTHERKESLVNMELSNSPKGTRKEPSLLPYVLKQKSFMKKFSSSQSMNRRVQGHDFIHSSHSAHGLNLLQNRDLVNASSTRKWKSWSDVPKVYPRGGVCDNKLKERLDKVHLEDNSNIEKHNQRKLSEPTTMVEKVGEANGISRIRKISAPAISLNNTRNSSLRESELSFDEGNVQTDIAIQTKDGVTGDTIVKISEVSNCTIQ